MKKLIIYIFLLFNNIINIYCNSNLEFKNIENKIYYVEKRLNYISTELEKFRDYIDQKKFYISKKIFLIDGLEAKVTELSQCTNHTQHLSSATFRLYKWSFIFAKKLKTIYKGLQHEIKLIIFQVDKSDFCYYLKFLEESISICPKLSFEIEQLILRLNNVMGIYQAIKDENELFMQHVNSSMLRSIEIKNQFYQCCCWL